jgi:hypothetical protein
VDIGGVFVFLILALVVLFALGYWTTLRATRHHETRVSLSSTQARQIVESSFSNLLWSDVQGPGDVNKRRRTMNNSGATISTKITATQDGRTHVKSWMSDTRTRYGMVASIGWPSAKKVITRLERTQA